MKQPSCGRSRVRPNPSVEARPNGRPPGPGWWYAYIFTSPGLASCRRSRLTSNVRPHEHNPPTSKMSHNPYAPPIAEVADVPGVKSPEPPFFAVSTTKLL